MARNDIMVVRKEINEIVKLKVLIWGKFEVNFQILIGMCTEADMGYKVERNTLSTIEFKSAEADMGYKND